MSLDITVVDIAIIKACAICKRASYKDYIDLYYILKNNYITLNNLIELAKKKYGNEFNDRLFLEQLISIEGISDEQISFIEKPITRLEIKEFFISEISQLKTKL